MRKLQGPQDDMWEAWQEEGEMGHSEASGNCVLNVQGSEQKGIKLTGHGICVSIKYQSSFIHAQQGHLPFHEYEKDRQKIGLLNILKVKTVYKKKLHLGDPNALSTYYIYIHTKFIPQEE
jgi:hypothetical protein